MGGQPIATGFRDVDASSDAAPMLSYLDEATALAPIRAGRKARVDLLAGSGRQLLDVGCGTGEVVRMMAEAVGATGRAVGIDLSKAMLESAHQRSRQRSDIAEYVLADAASLPFSDDTFDGTHAERVLQHVLDPVQAVREMVRVTRPGGTIVLAEPDWRALVLDAGAGVVTDRIARAVERRIRHPHAGRKLRRWMTTAHLTEINVEVEAHVVSDFALARRMLLLDETLTELAAAEPDHAAALMSWSAEADADSSAGRFTAMLCLFVARGRVPHDE